MVGGDRELGEGKGTWVNRFLVPISPQAELVGVGGHLRIEGGLGHWGGTSGSADCTVIVLEIGI